MNERGVEESVEHFFVVEEIDEQDAGISQLVGAVGMEVHEPYGLLRSFVLQGATWNPKIGLQLIEILLSYALKCKLSKVYMLAGDCNTFFEQIGFTSVEKDQLPQQIQKLNPYATLDRKWNADGIFLLFCKHYIDQLPITEYGMDKLEWKIVYPRTTHWWKLPTTTSIAELKKSEEIQDAAKALQAGELVAFPTETVYGLGADATSEEAVRSIFKAKGRPQDNPLILHIGNKEQLVNYVQAVPPMATTLIYHFWPGPLTLILKHKHNSAPSVTAGLSTVGIRMPDHPVALALLQSVDFPVAAPSANTSGRPSPTEAKHVWEDFLAGSIRCLTEVVLEWA